MEFGLFLEFPKREGATQQQAFEECFSLADEAEAQSNVDSVWLAEYHFTPDRVLSSPVTIATAIAARTQRIRIGLAVLCLPLGHPVRIAEEVATLDHISKGRLEFGVGRGTFPNVHEGYNVPFHESRGRFDEFLDVIVKSWTTEKFSYDGKYVVCQDLAVEPKPFQNPHPPIHVGITSEESFPIVGQLGYPILINPSRVFTLSELVPYIAQYRAAWKEAGHDGEGQVGIRVPIYVAETAKQAYEEPQDSAMFSVRRLGARVGSYATYGGTTGDWQAQSDRIMEMNYDDWLRDKVVYGTAESVTDRLHELTEELGLDQVMFEVNYGNQIPLERQRKSLRMFTEKVIPHFK